MPTKCCLERAAALKGIIEICALLFAYGNRETNGPPYPQVGPETDLCNAVDDIFLELWWDLCERCVKMSIPYCWQSSSMCVSPNQNEAALK